METPVYLFTGFLEAGKTSFIAETMRDPNFNDGKRKYLIITCEEGEEEYDPTDLGENVSFASFDDEQKITPDRLSAMQTRAGADIVVMEYNGMWMLDRFYNSLPENWMVYQEILVVDAKTAVSYNANMRSLMVDKLTSCEMVVFNRVTPETDKLALHKIVRGVSRKANICYEDTEGEIEFDQFEDPLPFDIEAPVIEINDIDFAIFYRDMTEDFAKYNGKKVRFKGIVALDPSLGKDSYAIGRHIMTCCIDDTTFSGLVCDYNGAPFFENECWAMITAKIELKKHPLYQNKGPVLKVTDAARTDAPEVEVVTFA